MNKWGDERLLVLCDCCSVEHQLIFTLFDKNNPEECELFVDVHLSGVGFLRRLIRGIKYIFGHKCIYGDFQEVILTVDDSRKIVELLNRYIDIKEGAKNANSK